MSEKWIPKIGDHVFSVCEFFFGYNEWDKKIPGYDNHGFEIVESVVKRPYHWDDAGMGVESVSSKRLLGDNANNCFYWRPRDYGKRVFRTFEEAIPLAEELTKYDEEHISCYGRRKPIYRHWLNQQEYNKRDPEKTKEIKG